MFSRVQQVKSALEILWLLSRVANQVQSRCTSISTLSKVEPEQAIGDALSDFLLVVFCLVYEDMSFEDWADMYCDFPSRHVHV